MRIMVCVKQVLDVRTPLKVERRKGTVTAPGMLPVINAPDVAALEAAVGLKEPFPEAQVLALTIGPAEADRVLRYCLARGADLAWRVWGEGLAGGNSRLTAATIARAAARFQPSLLFCGLMSEDNRGAGIPALVAEFLSWPWVSRAVQIELKDNITYAKVLQRGERGSRLVLNCPFPAVLAFDPALTQHHYVSVRRLKNAEKKTIEILTPEQLGINGSEREQYPEPVRVIKVRQPKPRTKRTAAPTTQLSGEDMMWQMIAGPSAKTETGNLVKGPPEELAERILKFLSENISVETAPKDAEAKEPAGPP